MWQRPIKTIHAGALMPRPRGVAEFTKTVAEFTKSSLAGKKLLQVLMIFLIFVVKLLLTNSSQESHKTKTVDFTMNNILTI